MWLFTIHLNNSPLFVNRPDNKYIRIMHTHYPSIVEDKNGNL